MKKSFAVACAAVLVLTLIENAYAHYTFIMPEKFRVNQGETLRIGFHSSDDFPESSALAKRLTDALLYTTAGPIAIGLTEDGKRMAGTVTIAETGYGIATVVNSSALENMRAESFTKYLQEEGLHHIVNDRLQRGEADKPGRERYTMYAKSIILAGPPNDAYKRAVGLPIEIIPAQDPSAIKTGEFLSVRVLFRGAPASGVEVMATSMGVKSHSVGMTNADGMVSVPMTSGPWRLHTIYMERSSNPDADWESYWATLTFEIP